MAEPTANRASFNGPLDHPALSAFLAKWGICDFALFGSVRSKAFRPGSDVDILVTEKQYGGLTDADKVSLVSEFESTFHHKPDFRLREDVERDENWVRRESILCPESGLTKDDGNLWEMWHTLQRLVDQVAGLSYDAFQQSTGLDGLQFSVAGKLLHIGGVAEKITPAKRSKHPEVPWADLSILKALVEDGTPTAQGLWQFSQSDAPRYLQLIGTLVPQED